MFGITGKQYRMNKLKEEGFITVAEYCKMHKLNKSLNIKIVNTIKSTKNENFAILRESTTVMFYIKQSYIWR